jgi:hypothetical protein
MLTKFINLFKKETWEVVREEEATISSWKYGVRWAQYDCVVIHEISNKGNKRYFMVELEGSFKGIKYPYDYDNKCPLVSVEDIPKFKNIYYD